MIPEIVLAHMIGDYLIQSDWMALEKTKKWVPAITHGITYTLPFLFITLSIPALLVICVTHIIIDHYRLAKYVVYAKNYISPRKYWPEWDRCKETGYDKDRPPFLAVWLMIIADNIIHVLINIGAIALL